jgi:hypothetical protein
MPITDPGLGTLWSSAAAQYVTSLLTDDFVPRLNDARNNSCPILGLIPSTSRRTAGKFIVEPVMFGRNGEAFNAVREGGKLPDPKTTSALVYAYRWRQTFARLKIGGEVLRAANKDDVAFIGALDRDMQALSDDMSVDLARQIAQGDGSGRIAEVSATVDADTIDIRLNSNIESVSTCTTSPAQYLYVGSRLAIMPSNGASVRGVRTISSIDSETVGPPSLARISFTANTPAGITAGDWLVKCSYAIADGGSDVQSTSFRTEVMGISGIMSDDGVLDGNGLATLPAGALSYVGTDDFTTTSPANFQGVPVSAANSWNRGIVMTGNGVMRPITEALLQLAMSRIEEQNNGRVDMMYSGYGVRDAYGISLLGEKRFSNTTELRGGWSVLDFNGKPWYADRNALKNQLFLLGLAAAGFTQHVNTTFQPLSPLGEHWQRLPDEDAYQAAYVMGWTMGVGVRERTGGRLTDLLSVSA